MDDRAQGLAGTLALLAATVAALFAVAIGVSDPARETVPSAQDPERLLELAVERAPEVARRVEELRGLEFEEVPVPEVSTAARLARTNEPRTAEARRRLEASEAELKLFGILDSDATLDDYAAGVSELAAAYYEPRSGRLFLVSDAVPAGPETAEYYLAHELLHALEDQNFELPIPKPAQSDDEALAALALIEGSATALDTMYLRRHVDALALLGEAASVAPPTSGLPRFLVAQVLFAYTEGPRFVAAARRLTGSWAPVDAIYESRIPESTEQILHPEKYFAKEGPERVPTPASPGTGWKPADTGTLGEFATREILREAQAGPTDTAAAAAGWGGDTYRLYTSGDLPCSDDCRATHAIGVRWEMESARDGAELAALTRRWVEGSLGGEREGAGAWRVGDGHVRLSRAGSEVGLGMAPSAGEAARLAGPVG